MVYDLNFAPADDRRKKNKKIMGEKENGGERKKGRNECF